MIEDASGNHKLQTNNINSLNIILDLLKSHFECHAVYSSHDKIYPQCIPLI